VVGSGAGGFEILMAMHYALRFAKCEFHWFLRAPLPISQRAPGVGQAAKFAAIAVGIHTHDNFDVASVTSDGVLAHDGREVVLDEVVWCTAASAPPWVKAASLATDERGFVATNQSLQSVSHPFVFATGDIGTQQKTPNAKAGVFAVRQAPVLCANLQRIALGQTLRNFVPQQHFLSLMATGAQHAIASWGPITLRGRWVWRWKDWIDRRFMQRFFDLPTKIAMTPRVALSLPRRALRDLISQHDKHRSESHGALANAELSCRSDSVSPVTAALLQPCSGCGAKVSSEILDQVLDELQTTPNPRLADVHGLDARDDVSVFKFDGAAVAQSVDQLREIITDPYIFGEVAAKHALSDIFTAASSPHSAQVLATVAFADPSIVRRDLSQLMHGVVKALAEAGCVLLGGHSNEGAECQLGLVINAVVPGLPEQPMVEVGDSLLLTQPLGVGVLFAARMQGYAAGVDIRSATQAMLQSNQQAAEILRRHGARCITDVTGFGLIGHLQRLLRGMPLRGHLNVATVPLLPGVQALASRGFCSTLWPHNLAAAAAVGVRGLDQLSQADRIVLADPQTSGGLLAVLPTEARTNCLQELQTAGYRQASVIGTLVEDAWHSVTRESNSFQGNEHDNSTAPLASPGSQIR